MSQENCSQEKRFKPNDELYFFNNLPNNLPRQSKRRSSILKTIDANLGDDRRASRRVSFANNLFLQELKSDGTTQLITEPFKNNFSDDKIQQINFQDENTEHVPVLKIEKRRKSSKNFKSYISSHYNLEDKNDYATVLNTSVNRTNAKRKHEENSEQKKDLNSLFCDDDMELTRQDKENNSSKFTFNNSNFSTSNMNLTFVNKSTSYKVIKIPKGFVTSSSIISNNNSSNMDLTSLNISKDQNTRSLIKDKENMTVPIINSSNFNDKENEIIINKSISILNAQERNKTEMFTSASMDLTDLAGKSTFNKKTCIYSSQNDMELTNVDLNKSTTETTNASNTYFHSFASTQSSTSPPENQQTPSKLFNHDDTSIVQFPTKNPKLNNLTAYSKSNLNLSEMDITNLGKDQTNEINPTKNTHLYSLDNDDMELTDLEINHDEEASVQDSDRMSLTNLSASNELNTTNINYSSSSTFQESEKNFGDQDSSVQFPIKNPNLNNLSALKNDLNKSDQRWLSALSTSKASTNLNLTSKADEKVNNLNTVMYTSASMDLTNLNEKTENLKTQMFTSNNMDLTSLNEKNENVKTQMYTSASMDLTNLNENTENLKTQMFTSNNMDLTSLNEKSENVKTQMYTSASMDLTSLNNSSETLNENSEKTKSEMELTKSTTNEAEKTVANEDKNTCIYTQDMEITSMSLSSKNTSINQSISEVSIFNMTPKVPSTFSEISAFSNQQDFLIENDKTLTQEEPDVEEKTLSQEKIEETNVECNKILSQQNSFVEQEKSLKQEELILEDNKTFSQEQLDEEKTLTQEVSNVESNKTFSQDASIEQEQNLDQKESTVEDEKTLSQEQVEEKTLSQEVSNLDDEKTLSQELMEDEKTLTQEEPILEDNKTLSQDIEPIEKEQTIPLEISSTIVQEFSLINESKKNETVDEKNSLLQNNQLEVLSSANDQENIIIPELESSIAKNMSTRTELSTSNLIDLDTTVEKPNIKYDQENQERIMTQVFTSAIMDLTSLNDKTEIIQTQMFSSTNMDLTNLNEKTGKLIDLSEEKEASSANSDMDLTDIAKEKSIVNKSACMNLTNIEKESSFANNDLSDMDLTDVAKEKSVENKSTCICTQEDMELTDMEVNEKEDDAVENKSSTSIKSASLSRLSSSNAASSIFSSQESNAPVAKSQASSIVEFPLVNPDLNNISKFNNQTCVSEMDISNNQTTLASSRIFTPRCSRLNTTSVKSIPCSRRFNTSNSAWAIKKDKIHSTANFKNHSLFGNRESLTLDLDLQFSNKKQNLNNKTLPINLKIHTLNAEQVKQAEEMEFTNVEKDNDEDSKTIIVDQVTNIDEQTLTNEKTEEEKINQTEVEKTFDNKNLSTNSVNRLEKSQARSNSTLEVNESIEILCRAKDNSVFDMEMSRNQISIKEELGFITISKETTSLNENTTLQVGNLVDDILSNINEDKNEKMIRSINMSIDYQNESVNKTATISREKTFEKILPTANKTFEKSKAEISTTIVNVSVNNDEPMNITKTISNDVEMKDIESSAIDTNQTVDEMLNQIQLNYSIKAREFSIRSQSNRSQLDTEFEIANRYLSTIIEPSDSKLELITPSASETKIIKNVFDNKTYTLDQFNLNSSKDESPAQAVLKTTFIKTSNDKSPSQHLQSTFTVDKTNIKNSTYLIMDNSNNETKLIEDQAKDLIENIDENLNSEGSTSLSDFKMSCSVGKSSQNSLKSQPESAEKQFANQSGLKSKNNSQTNQSVKDETVEKEDENMQVCEQEEMLINNKTIQKDKSIRRCSLYNNLSSLEKELNKDTMNDSVLAFQTQTDFDLNKDTMTDSVFAFQTQTEFDNTENNTKSNYNTNYQINEIMNQINEMNDLIAEKSFSRYSIRNVMMNESEKIKDFFSQKNINQISLKAFNGHVALEFELENDYELEYSDIKDINLILDLDKPVLKLWADKFYLFYNNRPEHRSFVNILKCIIIKKFSDLKTELLKYQTTEFLVNIKEEVESMLDEVSEFAKDVKATTLKFKNYEFSAKEDDSFDFLIDLFGVNKKFTVVLNVNYCNDLQIETKFKCLPEDKDCYQFENLMAIAEESAKETSLKINKIIVRLNRYIRQSKGFYLEEFVKNALKNWDA